MNLLQMARTATEIYLKHAYPESSPPEIVQQRLAGLDQIQSSNELLAWDVLEVEGKRYSLRLGNHFYPNMKLVFLMEAGKPVFYVDAHDSHFTLPPGLPGYDKLLALRESNKKIKKTIEKEWIENKVITFAPQNIQAKTKKLCKGMKVLAVDDESQILDLMSIIVTSLGATILKAGSAAEARDILADEQPDVIFCDIMMPEENGYDFHRRLRAEGSQVPFYFITGLALDEVEQETDADVLQKPFTARGVMNILKSLRKD